MLRKRPQTEAGRLGGQRSLGPLLVVRVQASKLLEASADMSVEGFKGASMEAGGHNPDREDHLAEGSAAAEQLKGDLGIRNLAEGGEDAEENLRAMCRGCHGQKTRRERQQRSKYFSSS